MTNVNQLRPRGIGFTLSGFKGQQYAPTDFRGIFDGLGPLKLFRRLAEIVMSCAGGDNGVS
jgi:hypothetical protein